MTLLTTGRSRLGRWRRRHIKHRIALEHIACQLLPATRTSGNPVSGLPVSTRHARAWMTSRENSFAFRLATSVIISETTIRTRTIFRASKTQAQAWNVVTVGACSSKVWPGDATLQGYTPIAEPGSLCPSSRTTLCWDRSDWTIKPDVVFEGGNYLKDATGFVTTSDNLMVLTTQLKPTGGALLGASRDTSAATAQVACMAANLQADYPDLWPESIRALLIHSAEWTPRMKIGVQAKRAATSGLSGGECQISKVRSARRRESPRWSSRRKFNLSA